MKKFIFILITMFLAVTIQAQDRTVNKNIGQDTYYNYAVSNDDADSLTSTQDTLDIIIQWKGSNWVKQIDILSKFDTLGGADSTVSMQLDGKKFNTDPTWTSIISASASYEITGSSDSASNVITSAYTETVASYVSTVTAFNVLQDTAGSAGELSDTLRYPAQTITNASQTVTPSMKTYRYYRIRYIYVADATGAGIKLDELEFKLYTD